MLLKKDPFFARTWEKVKFYCLLLSHLFLLFEVKIGLKSVPIKKKKNRTSGTGSLNPLQFWDGSRTLFFSWTFYGGHPTYQHLKKNKKRGTIIVLGHPMGGPHYTIYGKVSLLSTS